MHIEERKCAVPFQLPTKTFAHVQSTRMLDYREGCNRDTLVSRHVFEIADGREKVSGKNDRSGHAEYSAKLNFLKAEWEPCEVIVSRN